MGNDNFSKSLTFSASKPQYTTPQWIVICILLLPQPQIQGFIHVMWLRWPQRDFHSISSMVSCNLVILPTFTLPGIEVNCDRAIW